MVSVIIPTYNAINYLPALLVSLKQQTLEHELIIIDSSSTDGTTDYLTQNHVPFLSIPTSSFNHGTTRNLGASMAKGNALIYLTQDALPANVYALERLIDALFSSDDVALAYGRQLPYPDADIMSQFARLTNYPGKSLIKSKDDIMVMGIRACHCSNSFAAYKKDMFLEAGGFPSSTILGEDVTVAAHLVLGGKRIFYCAEAEVYHSHNYTLIEEFKRYFDIGVFHKQENQVLKPFTKAESEGVKYVLQEWAYLRSKKQLHLIPQQLIRTTAKYIGYRVGYWNDWLPDLVKLKLSMHSAYWKKKS